MNAKPEPIRVSAKGIEAKPVTMNAPEPAVDWRKLAAHPPFQMFVHERNPNAEGINSERWAFEYIERFVREVDADTLLQNYIEWHAEKGYWPDEDHFGNPV